MRVTTTALQNKLQIKYSQLYQPSMPCSLSSLSVLRLAKLMSRALPSLTSLSLMHDFLVLTMMYHQAQSWDFTLPIPQAGHKSSPWWWRATQFRIGRDLAVPPCFSQWVGTWQWMRGKGRKKGPGLCSAAKAA